MSGNKHQSESFKNLPQEHQALIDAHITQRLSREDLTKNKYARDTPELYREELRATLAEYSLTEFLEIVKEYNLRIAPKTEATKQSEDNPTASGGIASGVHTSKVTKGNRPNTPDHWDRS